MTIPKIITFTPPPNQTGTILPRRDVNSDVNKLKKPLLTFAQAIVDASKKQQITNSSGRHDEFISS